MPIYGVKSGREEAGMCQQIQVFEAGDAVCFPSPKVTQDVWKNDIHPLTLPRTCVSNQTFFSRWRTGASLWGVCLCFLFYPILLVSPPLLCVSVCGLGVWFPAPANTPAFLSSTHLPAIKLITTHFKKLGLILFSAIFIFLVYVFLPSWRLHVSPLLQDHTTSSPACLPSLLCLLSLRHSAKSILAKTQSLAAVSFPLAIHSLSFLVCNKIICIYSPCPSSPAFWSAWVQIIPGDVLMGWTYMVVWVVGPIWKGAAL